MLRGTVTLSTFPTAPTRAVAIDETGRTTSGVLGATGAFAVPLAKGHTYRLVLTAGGTSVPVIFPHPSGRLDETFALNTNGARISLGHVRYWSAEPTGGFTFTSTRSGQTTAGEEGNDTGVDDNEQTDCGDDDGGIEGQDDDGSVEGEHDDASSSENGGQGDQNEDGGSASEDARKAVPHTRMAVVSQDPPEDVEGCDGDDDKEGTAQEGTGPDDHHDDGKDIEQAGKR